jgi:hypothetical protein
MVTYAINGQDLLRVGTSLHPKPAYYSTNYNFGAPFLWLIFYEYFIFEYGITHSTVRTIISAAPLQNAVSHTTAERMQLLLCLSPIAVV